MSTTPTPLSAAAGPALPSTMSAVVGHRYGSTDGLAVEEVPTPAVGHDEVLIEVVAAGVDRGVHHLMTGTPYLVRLAGFGVVAPKQPILGMDVAGRVVEVGAAVERFAPGDAVMGIASGSFAEYAVASQDKLAAIPEGTTFEHAAAATISGITALQALTDVGRVEAGQRVLVLGASGGVGTFAVQIAVAEGATVTGVASGPKLDLVESLGATSTIDYRTTDVTQLADRYDLIIDVGGNTPIRRLRRILEPGGTLVIVGGENGGRFTGGIGRNLRALVVSAFVEQRLTFFISAERREDIDRLVDLMASGAVVPSVGRSGSLADAPALIDEVADGTVRGKAVVVVRAD